MFSVLPHSEGAVYNAWGGRINKLYRQQLQLSSLLNPAEPQLFCKPAGMSSLCCPCLHVDFIMTVPGILKIAEVLIGVLCQSLLLNYGISYAHILGASYASLLSTTCACVWSTCLLIFCYILSRNSYLLIRSTIFELIFNIAATLSYLSGSFYLAFSVKLYLYPLYIITIGFVAYPAMVASYSLGFILSVLYGLDSYYIYNQYQ